MPEAPAVDSRHSTACPECDLLLAEVRVPAGSEATCPRCEHVIHEGKPDSIPRALALSTAGLVLIGPGIGLPLMSLSVLGMRQESSLLEGVLAMSGSGYWEVALVVLLCAVIAPFLNLWLMFTVSLQLTLKHRPRWLPSLLRINHHVRQWAMLEVFLMGALVAMVKLKDMAMLLPGPGLYCFVGLMLSALLLDALTDEHEFWQALDELDAPGNTRNH